MKSHKRTDVPESIQSTSNENFNKNPIYITIDDSTDDEMSENSEILLDYGESVDLYKKIQETEIDEDEEDEIEYSDEDNNDKVKQVETVKAKPIKKDDLKEDKILHSNTRAKIDQIETIETSVAENINTDQIEADSTNVTDNSNTEINVDRPIVFKSSTIEDIDTTVDINRPAAVENDITVNNNVGVSTKKHSTFEHNTMLEIYTNQLTTTKSNEIDFENTELNQLEDIEDSVAKSEKINTDQTIITSKQERMAEKAVEKNVNIKEAEASDEPVIVILHKSRKQKLDEPTLPIKKVRFISPILGNPNKKTTTSTRSVHKKIPRARTPNIAWYETVSKRRLLKTGFVYDIAMSYHATPNPVDIHPEDPRRILKIYNVLEKNGLLKECKRIKSRKATQEEVTAIHSIRHYKQMKDASKFKKRNQYIELEKYYDSIYLNGSSFESGLYAAGSLIELLEALVNNEIRNAFAIIRPPGHHAEHNESMGFCLFNNIAIATRHCMTKLGVKKTVIVDWDIHFGNGTQKIFSEDPNVLYISLHRYENQKFYPADSNGAVDYTGDGKGKGTTVNIPWPCSGMTDADYLYAFKEIVIPIAMEFDPDLLLGEYKYIFHYKRIKKSVVVVSAGFDAAIDDPIGQCKVTPAGYAHMTHMLNSINNGKMAIALEGGYNLNSIALSALGCMNVLLGDSPPVIKSTLIPKKECVDTIFAVKQVQQEYWLCCR